VGAAFRDEADGLPSGFHAGSRVAGYWLEEQIGAGGMAVVFRAWDERLNRRVALKILVPALAADEGFRCRFIREARAAAAVDDPHIIPVFETGEAGGTLFIAMRYVPGGDARWLVRRVGPLSAGRAAAIVCSVASALDAAHAAGLVHRDVKPANMLVDVQPGRPDHVYLSDFGLSKGALSFSGPTGPGQFLGTVGYAAPEQIGGKLVDGRADQYSLACAAFELLGGAPPFPRDYAAAVIWAHMSEPPPLLTSRRPELPAAVDGVLAKALAKAPEDRYASCWDFANALCVTLNLVQNDNEAVISPRPDHRRVRIVWPAPAGAEKAGGISVATASSSAEVSRGRGTLQAHTAFSEHETMPGRLAMPPARARHTRARLPRHNGRSRLVALAAMLIAAVSVVLAVSQPIIPAMTQHTPPPHASLPPRLVAYLGVYVSGQPSYQPVANFGKAVGRQPNLAGYASNWGKPFAASFSRTLWTHGITPLVQIDPSDVSLAGIADGDDDTYLRAYAIGVRKLGHSVVISFGQDMNTRGHSWGYGNVPARTFIAAWRHIVTLFRDQGAENVTWLWTLQADEPGTGPVASWWPGAQYVTWVGIDGYYYRPSDTFASVFGTTIDQVRAFTGKPILLSETAVAPGAGQFVKIQDLFQGMATYKMLGLVWFDKDQHGSSEHQDWQIEDNQQAEISFRLGVLRELAPSPPAG
jgi:serine/threonine protein kinase